MATLPDPSRHALHILQALSQRWATWPASQQALAQREWQTLQRIEKKLTQRTLTVAVFGMVNRGKSALLNGLLEKPLLAIGPLNGVTHIPRMVKWDPGLEGQRPMRVRLVDTPGLNEVNGGARAQLAWHVAQKADLILFVIAGDIAQLEYQALLELRTLQKPILLVFNKIDLYPDQDRQAIYAQITSPRLRQLVSPTEIVLVAASPKPVKVRVHWPDQRVTIEWERPQPILDPLRQRLREIVQKEGEALLALNALVQLDRLNEQMLRKQLALQSDPAFCYPLSVAKSLLIALTPALAFDLLWGLLADLGMIIGMARFYHLPLTRHGLHPLGKKLAWSLGLLLLADLGSLMGWGGWETGGLGMGAALLGSYWLRNAAQTYLWQGSRWGKDSPKAALNHLLSRLESPSILSRLRQEVRSTLGLGQPATNDLAPPSLRWLGKGSR
ncbi:MAG: Era-like GTP-binding protein [Cyanobacteriota bacterium]|nr:Era-like GTP-binding protein [Cyanobacteriota bacterium]